MKVYKVDNVECTAIYQLLSTLGWRETPSRVKYYLVSDESRHRRDDKRHEMESRASPTPSFRFQFQYSLFKQSYA